MQEGFDEEEEDEKAEGGGLCVRVLMKERLLRCEKIINAAWCKAKRGNESNL